MTSVTTDTHQRAGQQSRQGWRSQVGMTAATLVLLGGAVLWQTRTHRGTTTEGAVGGVAAVAARRADTAGVSDQEMFSHWQRSRLTAAEAARTVYLVSSEEAAADVHALFAGLPPERAQYQVLVLDATEDGEQVLRMLPELAVHNHQAGLPQVVVVDLRQQRTPPTAPVLQREYPILVCAPVGDCIG
jgi:hypothetical protein